MKTFKTTEYITKAFIKYNTGKFNIVIYYGEIFAEHIKEYIRNKKAA